MKLAVYFQNSTNLCSSFATLFYSQPLLESGWLVTTAFRKTSRFSKPGNSISVPVTTPALLRAEPFNTGKLSISQTVLRYRFLVTVSMLPDFNENLCYCIMHTNRPIWIHCVAVQVSTVEMFSFAFWTKRPAFRCFCFCRYVVTVRI